jgi:hypothetical protein
VCDVSPEHLSLTSYPLLLLVRLTDSALDGLPRGNPIDPAEQVRELGKLFVSEAGVFPALDPWPGAELSNTVSALSVTSEVFALNASISARQLDLKHLINAQRLVAETVNCETSSCC